MGSLSLSPSLSPSLSTPSLPLSVTLSPPHMVFGIQFGTILYAFIVVIGQLIFAAGAYSDSFGLMLVGRFVFGAVHEESSVCSCAFHGNEILPSPTYRYLTILQYRSK
ncbi:hypothetical protein J6590_093212 [Homalodisca vitripennis]|nr:hypothetical protein J6590_093212 [Homalodisca vitripennis]